MKRVWIFIVALALALVGIILHFTAGDMLSAGDFAVNYFAAGNFACGVFAAGNFSCGIFSIGIFSVGIFGVGLFNIALYAMGFFLAQGSAGSGWRFTPFFSSSVRRY